MNGENMSTEKKRETEERRNNAFHSSVQVRLGKEDLFFGPGKARLMEYIEETGSMQEACTKMELSYSKLQTSGTQDWRKRRRRLTADGRRKGPPEKIPGTDTPCAGGC